MSFRLYRSNRTEKLIDALVGLVGQGPGDDPFAQECIVVQGKGMERWLSMQLARRLGVWANPSFPFPRKLIADSMTAALGAEDERAAAFEPEALRWSVARLLPELLPRPEFKPLRDYLADDDRKLKRMQLAARIATTFDHYVVYRPDLLLEWERGRTAPGRPATAPADEWQPLLWRHLVALHGAHHFAARAQQLLAALGEGRRLAPPFPSRISLFGLSTLPPLYVELLRALSASVDIHLFLLSPSREYWGSIRGRASVLRQALQRDGHLPSEAELQAIEGHPLLASLGRLGREFQEVLEGSVDYEESNADLYEIPSGESLLHTLQADIVMLQQRGADSDLPPLRLAAGDDSIRVHSCHGPLREIEVLHDRLLALFDADATLEPRDVIVMTPSIDAYAPYIEAVFRPSDDERAAIPHRIADRSTRAVEDVSDALFCVLDLLQGRFGASEVLDLLAIEAVRRKAGLAPDDLALVRKWIVESGIRWGVDAEHRAENGQPALSENTWRFGLDRLLLGYALTSDERELPYGVLPYDDIEGSETTALGRLAELCRVLFDYRTRLRAPRPMAAWRDDIAALLAATLANTNVNAFQHQRLVEALGRLAQRAEHAGFAEPVHLEIVRVELEGELRAGSTAHGFLSGGVTFCELVPMRTIPFRVVCLVGMSEGAFPRQRRPPGFDLIAAHPRAGDRSVREDDRYLFLEALLSAREKLLITHVGQSITDNSDLPPSVVVSELLDTVERSLDARVAPVAEATSAIVVRHPLQPFSPRNFEAGDDAKRFSYAPQHWQGAMALAAAARGEPTQRHDGPFIAAPLPAPEGERHVSVEQIVRFFENPTRAFLQNRLGLYLGRDLAALEDREPLRLDNLEEWKVGDAVLRLCDAPDEIAAARERERARGSLPPGELGSALFARIAEEAKPILARAAPLRHGPRLEPLPVELLVGDTRITGALRDLWPAGLVRVQYSRLGRRYELGLWIRHLIFTLSAAPGVTARSYMVGRAEKADAAFGTAMQFAPAADARPLLEHLVGLYWLGLRWPLPLFEGASRAYAATLSKAEENPAVAAAEKAARRAFNNHSEFQPMGDFKDANVGQVYGLAASLEDVLRLQQHQSAVPSFEAIAREIFLPLLDHRGKLE